MTRKILFLVTKELKKNNCKLVIFAKDTEPISIVYNAQDMARQKNVPTCFAGTRKLLGEAAGEELGTCIICIKKTNNHQLSKLIEQTLLDLDLCLI